MTRDGRGKLKGKRNKRAAARERMWEQINFKDNLRLMYSCQPWAASGR
jgi:hypothetical protein